MSREVFDRITQGRIVVTGPQRSGTTICAAMLADYKDIAFLPDEEINQSNLQKLGALVAQRDSFCLQAPALWPVVHLLSYDDMAVVVMVRPLREIFASQERIDWHGGLEEIVRYDWLERAVITGIPDLDFGIAAIKYFIWFRDHELQTSLPVYYVPYSSLDWHPLWVDKQNRADFWPRQIDPVHRNSLERE